MYAVPLAESVAPHFSQDLFSSSVILLQGETQDLSKSGNPRKSSLAGQCSVIRAKISPLFEIALVLACQSLCQPHRKRGSQHHVNGCCAWRSRLHCPACQVVRVLFRLLKFLISFGIFHASNINASRNPKRNHLKCRRTCM